MSIFQAIILGVLQGIAEFLPISSSGHLAVAQKLFGLSDVPLLFDVMLHLATLAAVILYFRKKIARLFMILFRWIVPNGKGACGSGTAFTETRSKPVSQVLSLSGRSLPATPPTPTEKKRKKNFKEQKEFENLENEILELEEKKSALEEQMSSSDFAVVKKAGEEYKSIEEKLASDYARWEELAELR